MTLPDTVYRCGLPVAMGFLAVGAVVMVAGAGVLSVAAVQSILGVGRAGRMLRAHGLAPLWVR